MVHPDRARAHGARTAPRSVVLQARADVVRTPHVDRHVVRLADGPEPRRFERLAAVVADVEAAVVAVHHVLAVVRVDPDRVVVHVTHAALDARERLRAVDRLRGVLAADEDDLGVRRIDANLAVVHRAVVLVGHERPRLALVVRSPDAARVRIRRRRRVAAPATASACARTAAAPAGPAPPRPPTAASAGRRSRSARRSRSDSTARCRGRSRPITPRGQTAARELPPRLAAVARLVDAAARPAADEAARRPAPLIRRREQDVRVRRIDDEIGGAGVVVDEQRLRPRLAAVGRHEDAALRVRPEQMSDRRDPDHVRVLRMDDDARDRLRFAQADVRERHPGVGGLEHAVTERRALPVVRLAGADVEHARIRRRDRDVADRVRAVAVEDRLEGGAVVDGLPQPAGARSRGRTSTRSPASSRRRRCRRCGRPGPSGRSSASGIRAAVDRGCRCGASPARSVPRRLAPGGGRRADSPPGLRRR